MSFFGRLNEQVARKKMLSSSDFSFVPSVPFLHGMFDRGLGAQCQFSISNKQQSHLINPQPATTQQTTTPTQTVSCTPQMYFTNIMLPNSSFMVNCLAQQKSTTDLCMLHSYEPLYRNANPDILRMINTGEIYPFEAVIRTF
jgi:hypothetical protein